MHIPPYKIKLWLITLQTRKIFVFVFCELGQFILLRVGGQGTMMRERQGGCGFVIIPAFYCCKCQEISSGKILSAQPFLPTN